MKIICIGRNYAAHAKELGNAIPEEPVLFIKPQSAYTNPNKPFYYPAFVNELHYEIELVLKICKNGKHISEKDAPFFYDQITVGVDFTARDKQQELKEKGLPWEKAKAFDNAAMVGNWLNINHTEKKNPIQFRLELNDITVQNGNSENMIYNFDQIIADASQYFTLNIGDLIFTGTPAGVGECVTGDNLKGFYEKQCLFDFTIR